MLRGMKIKFIERDPMRAVERLRQTIEEHRAVGITKVYCTVVTTSGEGAEEFLRTSEAVERAKAALRRACTNVKSELLKSGGDLVVSLQKLCADAETRGIFMDNRTASRILRREGLRTISKGGYTRVVVDDAFRRFTRATKQPVE